VAPFRGQQGAVSAALDRALGLGLPGPGEARTAGAARAIWFGRGQALVTGADIPEGLLDGLAAVTDQSDGWACLRLEGLGVWEVLARLTPIDLREPAFPPGATVRTLLGHMAASLTRWDADGCDILVFRSMTGTAVHEISTAMHRRAARLAARG
jgi:heterotetrameric sarcosine oxidase gamma subunit